MKSLGLFLFALIVLAALAVAPRAPARVPPATEHICHQDDQHPIPTPCLPPPAR